MATQVPPTRQEGLKRAITRRIALFNSGDLLWRYIGPLGRVPIAALLLDRRFRREVALQSKERASSAQVARTGVEGLGRFESSTECFEAIVAAADDLDLGVRRSEDGTTFRLTRELLPPAVAEGRACSGAGVADALQGKEEARSTDDGPGGPHQAAEGLGGRNVKGELQSLACKALGRPITKAEMVFNTVQGEGDPPMYSSCVEVLGSTYRGTPHRRKKDAEHAAALAALESLIAKGVAAPSGGGASSGTAVDYKGQLQNWLQSHGMNGLDQRPKYEVGRADPDAKVFVAKVTLPSLGGRSYEGPTEAREAHESSEKARRAAEHGAARVALEALSVEELKQDVHKSVNEYMNGSLAAGADASTPATVCRALALRLPAGLPDECGPPLPITERVPIDVAQGGFGLLRSIADCLHCQDVFPHPLQWAGDRPKGLCLYEGVLDAEESSCIASQLNRRATGLVGVPVHGDALLVDASAHSHGIVVSDVTGPRLMQLTAERDGLTRSPAGALNMSRGTVLAGSPVLPASYDERAWVGRDPKTLLTEILQKSGAAAIPTFELRSDEVSGTFFCSVSLATTATIHLEGPPCKSKAAAQQHAALLVLHQFAREAQVLEPNGSIVPSTQPLGSVVADQLQKWCLLEKNRPARPDAVGHATNGTWIVLTYHIYILGPLASLSLEEVKDLKFAVGGCVLHPALEELARRAPVGEDVTHDAECTYDGTRCTLRMCLHVSERHVEGEASLTVEPSKTGLFDPPLRQQRLNFILDTLRLNVVRSVLDLGCGDGELLAEALAIGIKTAVGVDRCQKRVRAAGRRLEAARADGQEAMVLHADLLEAADQRPGMDAVVLAEVMEHVPNADFHKVAPAVFACSPRLAIVTTPNADFRVDGWDPTGHGMRHHDHEREFTRDQFQKWAEEVAGKFRYVVHVDGVGSVAGQDHLGFCTQIAVFRRVDTAQTVEDFAIRQESPQGRCTLGDAATDDPAVVFTAQREGETVQSSHRRDLLDLDMAAFCARLASLPAEELLPGSGLMKYVEQEGSGERPLIHSRVRVHFATYLSDGRYIDASRGDKQCEPCAFQLGGRGALEAWQQVVASMRKGERCWVRSPPAFAFGTHGSPPRIPAHETMWFNLELVDYRPPRTVTAHRTLVPALEEGERHLADGRQLLERCVYGQARQAFRRALTAVPEKLLLNQPEPLVARFALLERSCLLNQFLCCQKLAETAFEQNQTAHWEEGIRVCSLLLQRHSHGGRPRDEPFKSPTDTSMIVPALQAVSAASNFAAWAAKAHFRRGLARERLHYLGDALEDYEAAARLAPADAAVARAAEAVRRRRQRVELRPEAMFRGILGRELEERQREAEAAAAEERRCRREARLDRQRKGAE